MKTSTAFVLLMISVGLFYTVIAPHWTDVGLLRAQSSEYKQILANVSELAAKRDDLNVKYENVPPVEVDKLEKILPGNVDTVDLAMNLDSIASRYGISIKNVEADESKSGTIVEANTHAYSPVSVSFSFVSTYANFRKFLQDIESSLRIIDVKSMTFQATDNGLYEFHVTVETYWLN